MADQHAGRAEGPVALPSRTCPSGQSGAGSEVRNGAAAMKLMILDGNSVINRAFYGIRPLTTRDGLPTNAIFGFLNILHRVEAEESPDALCVAFDLKAPTFRHKQYDGYKATRHAMPEELAQQMPVMKEVLRRRCASRSLSARAGRRTMLSEPSPVSAPRRRGTALSSPATATACSWWATGSRSSWLSPRVGRRLRRITRRSYSRRSMALRRRS